MKTVLICPWVNPIVITSAFSTATKNGLRHNTHREDNMHGWEHQQNSWFASVANLVKCYTEGFTIPDNINVTCNALTSHYWW